MQSLVCTQPRHFEYEERPAPVLEPGHAILRIRRVGICGTDLHAFEGTQPFFEYPRVLGHELAADVVEVDGAPGFKPGDKVTFIPYFHCGHCIACRNGKTNCCRRLQVCGVHIDGGMATYLSVPSESLLASEGLDYEELALVEPLSIGAHGVRRAGIRPGEFVLVIGAGPIGLGTMEFARIAGGRVIAMDINDARLNFCREKLQVPYTLNAMAASVVEQLEDITDGEMPEVVIDATGSLKAINDGFRYLSHGGRYVLIGLQKGEISFSHPEFHKHETTLMSSRNATREDFQRVMQALRDKEVKPTTYITHRVPFGGVKYEFETYLNPANGVIKAMVSLD